MLKPMRVLVLAPHTDDAELACGGTIAKLVAGGSEVHVAAFSDAKNSLPAHLPPDTLRSEFNEAMRRLSLPSSQTAVYDYSVRVFSDHRQAILDDLIALRRRIQPELVLMPSRSDLHQDHQVICAEGLRAFKEVSVWGYECPWNQLENAATAFVTLDEPLISIKWHALEAYRSQFDLKRAYFDKAFVTGWLRMRGVQIKAEYAECFEVMRVRW
jgi:N-acetylglucosamine malate deacetylase 1